MSLNRGNAGWSLSPLGFCLLAASGAGIGIGNVFGSLITAGLGATIRLFGPVSLSILPTIHEVPNQISRLLGYAIELDC